MLQVVDIVSTCWMVSK